MAVYIFATGDGQQGNARNVHDKIHDRGLTIMNYLGHEYREEKTKIYRRLENGWEEEIGDSLIIIDSELGFTIADVKDTHSFGNGVTLGSIRLKDGRKIKCGWVVIDQSNVAAANGMLTALKNIFKGAL